MKVSSDWIVYFIRANGYCPKVHNRQIGIAVASIFRQMGCPQNPEGVQVPSPLFKEMKMDLAGDEFASVGLVYDVPLEELPVFLKKLGETLGFDIS